MGVRLSSSEYEVWLDGSDERLELRSSEDAGGTDSLEEDAAGDLEKELPREEIRPDSELERSRLWTWWVLFCGIARGAVRWDVSVIIPDPKC